jgi:transposase
MERYVGIDLGLRTKHKVTVYDGLKQVGKPFAVETSQDGFEYLLKRVTAGTEGPVNFVFEPTSNAWLPVSAYVSAAGHRCYLVKTQKASDLRKFYSKHAKSDSIDSGVLARLPQLDPKGVHELFVPTAQETTLKRLVKRRERCVSDTTKQKLRIHALLLMANPLLMGALGQDKFGTTAVAFLKKYLDPVKVVNRGLSGLRQFWDKHSKGQADKQRAEKVFEACQGTVALYRELREKGQLPFDYDAMQEELKGELALLEEIERQAKRIEKQMIELYKSLQPERVLEQLCGVGAVIAANLVAMIGNIKRFKNCGQFVSYCGLCPRKNQTGNSDKKMKITKAGQPLLRKSLYLAADVARQWDPEFAAYYGRRYAKGDHHDYIIIALARKMALRVYALLKRREAAKQMNRQSEEAAESMRYVLRTPEGEEVGKKEARKIIEQKYARDVVAPQRAAKDRTGKKTGMKNKKAKPAVSYKDWPLKDATIEATATPLEAKIVGSALEDNQQID